MDVKDVQLLVGAATAATAPPDIFSSVDTHQTIEQILEELNFPTDPAQLQAMLGEVMTGEDLNAVIAALDSSETQYRLPAGSLHNQPSQEPTTDPVNQGPTVVKEQQGVTVTKLRVSDSKATKDIDAGTTSALEQDLSQSPTQILEARGGGLDRELGTIFTGEDLFQVATQVLDLNDPKELDFLKDIDINELKDLDLKDIDLEGINIAEVIASLQNQQSTTETGSDKAHDGKIDLGKELTEITNGGIGGTVSNSNKDIVKECCTENAAQDDSGGSEVNLTAPQRNSDSLPLPNINSEQLQEDSLHSDGTIQSHTRLGTLYKQQSAQISTDDGSLEFSALDELDGSKLLEIQNAIQGFGGMPNLDQSANENSNGSTIIPTSTTELLPSRPLNINIETQIIRADLATENVNVDQIPQEVVSMSIGKLLDTSNVNMSSLSQDTQEQLLWLVNQMNNSIHPQDEFVDEGEDGDDDKSKKQARIREENRERKKRWRESNQDRNKDNDLRCRVTKRAAKLFGHLDTNEKKTWMETEFSKRKEKREAKERARYHDDRVSTSPCFGSYPQQHHNHSGGTSTTFSSSLHSASVNENRESVGNPSEGQGNSFRNRASSVAESTTSSVNDNDGPELASAGALKILSNPEAAQKLLQNSEAMQLLSNNPEVLAFLQTVIQSSQPQPSSISNIDNSSSGVAAATKLGPGVDSSVKAALVSMPAIPQANNPISDSHQQASEETKPSIDISIFLEMSEEELETKLNTMDTDTAQVVLTQLLEMQGGSQAETFLETTAPSTTPVEQQMGLDPDVQRILDTPSDSGHEVQLNLSLVNDKLINFSAENFSINHLAFDEGHHVNGGLDMMMDLGGEPGDINTKLLQALQGVLDVNSVEQPSFLEASPPRAPPPTPQKPTLKKRPAPGSDEEQQESSPPQKRHQASSMKMLSELSPNTAQAIAQFLQTSGIDIQSLGAATSFTPSSARTSIASSYPTNHMPRYAPIPVPTANPTYMIQNTYNTPGATTSRPAIPKPPVTTVSQQKPMSAAAAHAASFGNSAAMNQRLMPPPAYRPPNLGVGYGGFNSMPAIPKKKPDDRIVKAMGFPPMLAGIKKKAPS